MPQSASVSYTGTKDGVIDSPLKESAKEYISVVDIDNGLSVGKQN